MVCAMQEMAAVQQQQQHQQHTHPEHQEQQQHQQHQQQHQQQQRQQNTTIVLLTPIGGTNNLQIVAAPTAQQQQQQHHQQQQKQEQQQQQQVKSQQLKQQHSALVKLLESAPLSKQASKSAPPARQVVYFPQQHKRLKNDAVAPVSAGMGASVLPSQLIVQTEPAKAFKKTATPTTTINSCSQLNTSSSGHPPQQVVVLLTQHQQQHQHQRLDQPPLQCGVFNAKNDNESGIDEDCGNSDDDMPPKTKSIALPATAAAAPAPAPEASAMVASAGDKLNSNEGYEQQCPWKKIRFARELKQRELEQQQLSHKVVQSQSAAANAAGEQPPNNNSNLNSPFSVQTHKEIASLLMQQSQQQFRRDSSDSNCSLLSNSSTKSTVAAASCTCNSSSSSDEDVSVCDCHQQQMDDHVDLDEMDAQDSGCDDELCEQHQQQRLEASTLNYLCQKFDENLDTALSNTTANGGKPKTGPGEGPVEGDSGSQCHGFFRRSIQQKIQYRPCTKNQQCSILRINRNRCQYCRLKKCIAVGMSRDAVRFGRVPKREKARILAAMQQSTQNRGQQRALATELDDQPRLLAAVLRAHLETCEFTKEKVSAMRQRARECPSYSMPTLLACPLNPAPELQSEQEFSQRFAHVIRGVIDFAGMIPGFQLLTQDDKFTLLKAGLFDALFVRLICMFDSSINSIICLNGQVMRRDAIQNGANARFLVDSTFNFAERMNSMNLTDAEIGLFCAIVLITPDRPGLRNLELIEKMYSRLKGCLQVIVSQNRPDQPEFLAKLLETMPDLRTLSTLHTEKLVVFRTEHKELLRQQMWCMEDSDSNGAAAKSPCRNWDAMDVEGAKSPLGSVSSTESGDLEYNSSTTTTSSSTVTHMAAATLSPSQHQGTPSALASSAPLLAATLSSGCPRNRANSGSSGDSSATDMDIVGSHAHLTQNGLTITPIIRHNSQQHQHPQLHHHLTSGSGTTTHHRYRKLDSPTDSGIESGNEKNECGGSKTVSSGGSSSCSSPRSSVDDALDCSDAAAAAATTLAQVSVSVSPVRSPQPSSASSSAALKRQMVEDMPVLKRVLQAPPLYDTNSLMDEAYKPHKKFRALRHREFETAEADASSSTGAASTTSLPVNSARAGSNSSNATPPPPSAAAANSSAVTVSVVVPQTATTPPPPPSHAAGGNHQSQLHMHLTRSNPLTQPGVSTLSSTHSVLAKSLMAEPRMTPEHKTRSDIIQNYLMRDPSSATPASSTTGSRSPAPSQHGLQHAFPSTLPASSHSNCASPSTTTGGATLATLVSPPLLQQPGNGRWASSSVITTSCQQRQQSVSPHSNGSSSSSSSSSSSCSASSSSASTCQYFQSPHSTSSSISVTPPRPSPPRLLELQVDIADSQQPLNLSKKSPTPPPNKLQALVAAANAVQQQRYPSVSADLTVTATTSNQPATPNPASSSGSTGSTSGTPQSQVVPSVHKVMLEA